MAAYEEEDDDGYFVIAAAAYEEEEDDGFVIAAASEEEDDDYIKVITTFVPPPLPLPLPSSSSSSSSHVCDAAIASPSPAPYVADAEEQIVVPSASPAAYCIDDVLHEDGMAVVDAVPAAQQAPTHPVVFRYRHRKMEVVEFMGDEAAAADDDDEEDEDDYMYQGYYDLADRGRARHVKRSSGRRGRTKKASTMGRPRGDVRLAHCSVNL